MKSRKRERFRNIVFAFASKAKANIPVEMNFNNQIFQRVTVAYARVIKHKLKGIIMDKYTLRQNIADYTCKHFFDGRASLKGKIIKDLAVLDSDTLMDYNIILKNQEDYILDELRKMDTKNSFKFPYGRFKYLCAIVQRLIKESRKESIATLKDNPDQIPEHHPPKVEEPERKLTYAQRQNVKNFPNGDIPVITETDLFEVDPDMEAIHEAWLKLSEEERCSNWNKAIAEHKQRR